MTYRSGPCTFCDLQGHAGCPRCAAWVCASHDLGPKGHCALCAKELRDDLEERRFARDLGSGDDGTGMFTGQGLGIVQYFTDTVGGWLDRHAVQKRFDARTADDIAAWRARAGVSVRR